MIAEMNADKSDDVENKPDEAGEKKSDVVGKKRKKSGVVNKKPDEDSEKKSCVVEEKRTKSDVVKKKAKRRNLKLRL